MKHLSGAPMPRINKNFVTPKASCAPLTRINMNLVTPKAAAKLEL